MKSQTHIASFIIIKELKLIKTLIKRDMASRYQGTIGGFLWAFATPLLMLFVYSFVFGVIFDSKFNVEGSKETSFSFAIFFALLLFNVFSESLSRSTQLIRSNQNYVKKIVFPLHLLPFVPLGSSLFHMAIGFGIWALFYGLVVGPITFQFIFLPLYLIPLIGFSLGCLWLVSAISVYIRDFEQVIGPFITGLLFLSAVFYPISSVPEAYRTFMYLNPLAVIIDDARLCIMFGQAPNYIDIAVLSFYSIVFAGLGLFTFQKLRKGFADVI